MDDDEVEMPVVEPAHPFKDQLWQLIRMEAWKDVATEPSLAPFLNTTILSSNSLEEVMTESTT